MVPVFVLLFVALWIPLPGDLFYVFTLCYFVLVFFSSFSIAITSFEEERELVLVLFVRLFNLRLFWFCQFPLPLGVWEGLRLWHILDFSLTLFAYVQADLDRRNLSMLEDKFCLSVHLASQLFLYCYCSQYWKQLNIWANAWQNLQNGMCAQRRLRSACASAQSDHSLRCALNG